MLDAQDRWQRQVSRPPIAREKLRRLKVMADNRDPRCVDAYVNYLTWLTTRFPPPPPRAPVEYRNVKL